MGQVYQHSSTVTIGDTNLLQNMYFLNHIKLQGIIRELWVKDCVPGFASYFAVGNVLITKDVHCNYHKEYHLFDPILIHLQFADLRQSNVRLVFKFYGTNSEDLRADGYQTIYCANSDHDKIEIPPAWRYAISQYLVDGAA